jgi:hypothetical protein
MVRRGGAPLGKSLGAERNFGLLAFESGHLHHRSASRADVVTGRIWPWPNDAELR